MKRIILFSHPIHVKEEMFDSLFPKEMGNKVFAYMPVYGASSPQEYTDYWKAKADKHGVKEFIFIDNTSENGSEEVEKLAGADILLITGGNTFQLLNDLRKTGLDKGVIEFSKKDEFVLSGFSAGALVLGPTIELADRASGDVNKVGLKDFTALGIVDLEVFPHFVAERDEKIYNQYSKQTTNEVKKITDEEFIKIDL